MLERRGGEIALRDWGSELLADFAPIADKLDAALGGTPYREALALAVERWSAPDQLPSARVLAAMKARHASSHLDFVAAQSVIARREVLAQPMSEALMERFAKSAQNSLDAQAAIEAADTMDFESFRQRYLEPTQLRG